MRGTMVLGVGLLLALGGCTQFPAVDATIGPAAEAADYPALVPVGPLLAAVDARQIDAPATEAALLSRVAALQARAARLRRGGLAGPERQRLEEGLR